MRIPEVEIPYQKFVLDNGLTLIVHEDHKAPIVAVNVWYHVGSKNEPVGKTGFAHLFEHLMFNGSEHYRDDFFRPLEQVGATDMNGTTNEDRTNFFENVPTPALDLALWMESERMGYLLGGIDQAVLDEQRGVVKNEKRQRENVPYGKVSELLPSNTYPAGHPYSWSVIGSMQDLDQADLNDVRQWFESYYGAANAVLVVAGDINPDEVRDKVEHYFGEIASGPPVERQNRWIAKMHGQHRQSMQDQVPQSRIYKVWNVPPRMSAEAVRLELAADLLSGSKSSRLYKRLVYEDQIATSVSAFLDDRELGSQFMIVVTAKPNQDPAEVERILDDELTRFLADGPDEGELERSKTGILSGFLRGSERIGGFGGKSDILASSQIYGGSPDAYRRELAHLREAGTADVRQAARNWLSDGVYVLTVNPMPAHRSTEPRVDRSRLPAVERLPELEMPALERATLDNGLKVVLARRDAAPVVDFRLVVDAGYAADPTNVPGTANMAFGMLDEGTRTRSALEISDRLDQLGAFLSTGSSLDASHVDLSALATLLDDSLELYADVIKNPAFPAHELERLKRQQLARIQQEKSRPTGLGLRVLPPLLYGKNHAYSAPLTGSGTEASVSAFNRDGMMAFHRRWIRPDNATLIVVGQTDMATLKPLLERHLGDWRTGGNTAPEKDTHPVELPPQPRIYLMDRPGAEQSVIITGSVAPPKNDEQDIPISTVNAILGGMFTSRINMNLREDKHWSYGARTMLINARGQQPFLGMAPVERDKTAEAMQEIQRELEGLLGDKPATADELSAAQKNLTLKLPGENETNAELAATLSESVVFNLPDDYHARYVERVRSLTLEDIEQAARTLLHPRALTWVVVGDISHIEGPVRELGLGQIQVLDADGNPREVSETA